MTIVLGTALLCGCGVDTISPPEPTEVQSDPARDSDDDPMLIAARDNWREAQPDRRACAGVRATAVYHYKLRRAGTEESGFHSHRGELIVEIRVPGNVVLADASDIRVDPVCRVTSSDSDVLSVPDRPVLARRVAPGRYRLTIPVKRYPLEPEAGEPLAVRVETISAEAITLREPRSKRAAGRTAFDAAFACPLSR